MSQRFYVVALYVLVAIAPLVSIALAAAIGTAFAVSFYVAQPDHRRSPWPSATT